MRESFSLSVIGITSPFNFVTVLMRMIIPKQIGFVRPT